MNLQGKIVKVHFPENERVNNNNQATAPAIVTADWSPEVDTATAKALNLQIFTDCNGTVSASSVMHNEISYQPLLNFAWEMYD